MRNFIITLNGKSYEVGVEEVGATAPSVVSAPVAQPAVVAAPAAASAPVAAAAPAAAPKAPVSANGEKVISPFPGLIKNLLVAEGASVKKDDAILVLEAMKMETPVAADKDGVVASVDVAVGAVVAEGDVMLTIG